MATRWFVESMNDGRPLLVARIREELEGTYPEAWNGHEWRAWPTAMSYLRNPTEADEVDEARAQAVIEELAQRRRG